MWSFEDPIDKNSCLAAIAPVMVQGRAANISNTGWIVVVEDTSSAEVADLQGSNEFQEQP